MIDSAPFFLVANSYSEARIGIFPISNSRIADRAPIRARKSTIFDFAFVDSGRTMLAEGVQQ
jgi:hypothetical protein